MINHIDHGLAWVAVMKSGTIVTVYCPCITGYAILFGAMDCVSICEYMLCTYVCVYVCMYVHIYVLHMYCMCVSLGTLVPNSRDRHEKQWRPDFTRHKTHPKIRFV